jgi:hypothetical protein
MKENIALGEYHHRKILQLLYIPFCVLLLRRNTTSMTREKRGEKVGFSPENKKK